MPLGAVQMRSSGEYKNIICDRADQIESTLAHVVPEFTANIVGAIAMFIYMMHIDWRVGLWQLICIPAGFIAFSIMMASTPKYYPDTIKKNKSAECDRSRVHRRDRGHQGVRAEQDLLREICEGSKGRRRLLHRLYA